MVLKPQLAELAPEPKPFSSKSIIYSLPEVRFQCHKHGVKLRAAGFVRGHWHSEQCASSQLAAPDLRRVRSRYPRFISKDSGDQRRGPAGGGSLGEEMSEPVQTPVSGSRSSSFQSGCPGGQGPDMSGL